DSRRPWFPEPVPNVTVIVGKDALLTCVVQDLHNFKVSVVMADIYVYISGGHEIRISEYSNSNLNQILIYLYTYIINLYEF
ncbi:lachesin-like, partial [Aphis craccivora]